MSGLSLENRIKRIYSVDVIRGIAIMSIVIFHRFHYDLLAGYMLKRSEWLLSSFLFLMMMAGIFYLVTGMVNGYLLYHRIVLQGQSSKKILLGQLATGLWILLSHYFYRTFLMNGFIATRPDVDLHPPIGQLIGLIRTGKPVPFYLSQVIDPGTLSMIAQAIIITSLIIVLLLKIKPCHEPKCLYRILATLGTLVMISTPFVRFLCYPLFEHLLSGRHYLSAALINQVIGDFSFFPFIGFACYGAIFGIALANQTNPQKLKRTLIQLSTIWLVIGVTGCILTGGIRFELFISRSFKALVNDSFIRFIQLSLFLFFIWIGLTIYDFKPEKYKIMQKRFALPTLFGSLALTVYCFEPLLAELLRKMAFLLYPSWTQHFFAVLLFAFGCLLAWTLILILWRRAGFKGSLEWLGIQVIKRLSGKQSTKLDFGKNPS
jgi:hypothetical protein